MKKRAKNVETSPIRVYERIVRKLLLNNLSLLFSFLLTGSAWASLRPSFVVLSPDADLARLTREVQLSGGRVRQRVPPRVFVADVPPTLDLSLRPGVQTVYTSAIPLDQLRPLGVVATAAGTQWNRQMLGEVRSSGGSAFGAMRTLVAQRSLPSPGNVQLLQAGGSIDVRWSPVDAALYYEIHGSASPDFSNPLRTRTMETRTRIPVLGGSTHVRIRAIDTSGSPSAAEDVRGAWSAAASLSSAFQPGSGNATPILSSPLNRSKTEGFTLILEWVADGDSVDYRVQVARDRAFGETVFDEVVSGGEYACPGAALREGDVLFWRVRRWDAAGSDWSDVREARIGAPRHTKSDTFVNPEAPQ